MWRGPSRLVVPVAAVALGIVVAAVLGHLSAPASKADAFLLLQSGMSYGEVTQVVGSAQRGVRMHYGDVYEWGLGEERLKRLVFVDGRLKFILPPTAELSDTPALISRQ